MEIEFDPNKAASNLIKHGISFEESSTALLDPLALVQEDPDAEGENRWVLIGMSHQARLLTVVYTLRNECIRLISARKATKKEVKNYA
ncbi:BrnT family toxin [Candidatus Parabeggiatoa sp. HSG14]|uniref:BrnT family toxin n=1 Tax=Candidatus Parabeggiatoa sp. HSG14 TaxID=3055593 RepID=UPI0025A8D5B4|nr:BrnT family toxin [Thiotrichales bacterium HSG14]